MSPEASPEETRRFKHARVTNERRVRHRDRDGSGVLLGPVERMARRVRPLYSCATGGPAHDVVCDPRVFRRMGHARADQRGPRPGKEPERDELVSGVPAAWTSRDAAAGIDAEEAADGVSTSPDTARRRILRLPQRKPPPSLRSGDYLRCELLDLQGSSRPPRRLRGARGLADATAVRLARMRARPAT